MLLSAILVLIAVLLVPSAQSQGLKDAIELSALMEHLQELDSIARLNGLNSRAVRKNYNASVEYIFRELIAYCPLQVQLFKVPVHEELERPQLNMVSPYTTTFQYNYDFIGMRNGGYGRHNLTTRVQEVLVGCDATDFANFIPGHIALIQEGTTCPLVDIALLAEKSGASAIFFYNRPTTTYLLTTRIAITGWREGDALVTKPVFALSNLMGKLLLETPSVVVSLYANMQETIETTMNVICDSSAGSKENVVMAGAHLDSVDAGAGINDNGSGSSSLLEIAIQFFKTGVANVNAVRFAWWGAEEIGLLGSRHYVRDLQETDPETLANLVTYLNFDMLGSPNYVPFIYDPYVGTQVMPEETRAQSQKIQFLFEDYFKEEELSYSLDGMYGGSDYRPFCEAAVPCGGLYSGSSELKTVAQRETYKGFANAQLDTCYHQSCDTLENIGQEVLRQCARGAAQVIEVLSTMENVRDYLGLPKKK